MIPGMSINNHGNYKTNSHDMWTKNIFWLHHGANHTLFTSNILKYMGNIDIIFSFKK